MSRRVPIRSLGTRYSGGMRKQSNMLRSYEVLTKLGTGSFATVYLARKNVRNVTLYVALKKMEIDDPTALAEISILSKLPAHENIVSMYEYFQDTEGSHLPKWYLALEYCGGGSLNTLLFEEEVPLDLGFELMRDIASAVVHLHRHGIVHCDIKGDNILLAPGPGRKLLKLTDFSIARKLSQSGRYSIKLAREFSFGPYYSSAPEVFDRGPITDRSDIYSLALVLLSFFVHTAICSEDGRTYLVTPFALSPPLYGKALREVPQAESDSIVHHYVIDSLKAILSQGLSLDATQRPFAEAVLRDIDLAAAHQDRLRALPLPANRFVHTWHPPY